MYEEGEGRGNLKNCSSVGDQVPCSEYDHDMCADDEEKCSTDYHESCSEDNPQGCSETHKDKDACNEDINLDECSENDQQINSEDENCSKKKLTMFTECKENQK